MSLGILKRLFRRKPEAVARPERFPEWQGGDFVAFITPLEAPHFLSPGERLESDQASVRLRVGWPASELALRHRVCLVPIDYVQKDPELLRLGTVRAIVVGKLPISFLTGQPDRACALLDWIESMADRCGMVVDLSDDLGAAAAMYHQPQLIEIQRRLLGACPATVPCAALAQRLAVDARHGITVIEDPFESTVQGIARFSPAETLTLAWFGVFGPPLRPFIETQLVDIARALGEHAVELAFVTAGAQAPAVAEMAASVARTHRRFRLRHVNWSLAATAAAIEAADLVILPQDATSDWGRVKSHNRLIETIRAGRLAVASAIPSYLELAAYAWVGDDLSTGINWAIAHPQEALARVTQGQVYVADRFSPAAVGAKWRQVLGL